MCQLAAEIIDLEHRLADRDGGLVEPGAGRCNDNIVVDESEPQRRERNEAMLRQPDEPHAAANGRRLDAQIAAKAFDDEAVGELRAGSAQQADQLMKRCLGGAIVGDNGGQRGSLAAETHSDAGRLAATAVALSP
jgi:hypothetical protein